MSKAEVIDSPAVHYEWDRDRGVYTMPGRCHNCGHEATIRYRKGYRATTVECTKCGCKTMAARSRGWAA